MNNKRRILIVGFNYDKEKIEEEEDEGIISINWIQPKSFILLPSLPKIPTIFDFDIVLLNLPSLDLKEISELNKRKDEFIEFFKSGGVLVSFLVSSKYSGVYFEYQWCPINYKFSLVGKPGDSIKLTKYTQEFTVLFDKYRNNIKWLDAFKYVDEKDTRILAENRAGHPISSIFNVENGKIVFLPNFELNGENRLEFERTLINVIKKLQKTSEISTKKPEWLKNYKIAEEADVDNQIEVWYNKKISIELAKTILYEYGPNLTNAVTRIFQQFGFEVLYKEEEGREDIEINDLESKFHAIVEVTGSSNQVNVDKIRQLFDWYSQKILEDENVNAVLIANALREMDPMDRKEPYTEKAKQLAKNNNFILLTTLDLFNLYNQFLKGEINKNGIVSRLSKVVINKLT